jgi:hypothetical protein
MTSNILIEDIDAYAGEMRRTSRLLHQAKMGLVTPRMVGAYWASLHFLFRHTPVHLEQARRRAEVLGHATLAAFFRNKAAGEEGHDEWAADDRTRLTGIFGRQASQDPLPTMFALVRSNSEMIEEHPALYLSYILFAEYFHVVMGGEWMAALQDRCGVPMRAMTALSYHLELDRHHVEENCREMDRVLPDGNWTERLRASLARSMAHFSAFCDELSSLESIAA